MRWLMTLLVAIGSLAIAAGAGADQTYGDAAGDSGNARDLTQVIVTNDATRVSFAIATSAQTPAWDEGEVLDIDKDANPSTGDEGADIRVWLTLSSVETWNGSDWIDASASGVTMRFEVSGAAAVWRVVLPRTLLAGATMIDFSLWSVKINGSFSACCDFAPDQGTWRYELVLKQCANGRDDDGDGKIDSSDLGCSGTDDDLESDDPYTLSMGKATVTPASGKAGKPVVVRAQVRQVETSQPIQSGNVRCTMKVGSVTKRSAGQLTGGTATCRLTAPKVAKTTTVRGTITVVSKGLMASAPYSFRVTK